MSKHTISYFPLGSRSGLPGQNKTVIYIRQELYVSCTWMFVCLHDLNNAHGGCGESLFTHGLLINLKPHLLHSTGAINRNYSVSGIFFPQGKKFVLVTFLLLYFLCSTHLSKVPKTVISSLSLHLDLCGLD